MPFKKADVASFRSKIKSSIRKKIENDIVFERANCAIRTAYALIELSPVVTGTYVNAHTIEINGIRVREPDISDIPIINIIPMVIIKDFAHKSFVGYEYEILLTTPISSSVSIIMPYDIVYWGLDYVEPTYFVYKKALDFKHLYSM